MYDQHVTSGEVREAEYNKQWSAQSGRIFAIRGKSADLRGRYIVGTLRNNANIII